MLLWLQKRDVFMWRNFTRSTHGYLCENTFYNASNIEKIKKSTLFTMGYKDKKKSSFCNKLFNFFSNRLFNIWPFNSSLCKKLFYFFSNRLFYIWPFFCVVASCSAQGLMLNYLAMSFEDMYQKPSSVCCAPSPLKVNHSSLGFSERERIIFITHCLKQWSIIDDIGLFLLGAPVLPAVWHWMMQIAALAIFYVYSAGQLPDIWLNACAVWFTKRCSIVTNTSFVVCS